MADLEVTCPCGKNFRRKAAYDRHMEVAHSETVSHKCKICGKTFGNSNTLTMHMSVHETKQNFAKLVRTRKAAKTAALAQVEKTEETNNKEVLDECAENEEDSSSEKENSECQTSPAKSIVTSDSSVSSKHDPDQNILSEKTTVNSAKKCKAAQYKDLVMVKSSPLPSLKEIIDSQSPASSPVPTTSGSAKVTSCVSRENSSSVLTKSSSKSKGPEGSASPSEPAPKAHIAAAAVPESSSKMPVSVSLVQSMTSQGQSHHHKSGEKRETPVISVSDAVVGKACEAGAAVVPAQVAGKSLPALGHETPPVNTATGNEASAVVVTRTKSAASRASPAATTRPAPLPVTTATGKSASSVTSSHPAFAAILSAPPTTAALNHVTRTPAAANSVDAAEVANAVNAFMAEPTPTQDKLYAMDKTDLQRVSSILDDTEDKLADEDFDFITDEDLEELEQDDDDVEDEDGEENLMERNKEFRKSKRKRSENPIWKSLLTGKVYEEILNNLEGNPPPNKRSRKDASDPDVSVTFPGMSQEMEDLPVKVEAIPQLDCIKTEPFDPDFPDLDQLEAAASLESPTGSSSDQSISPPAISPKIELTDVSGSDLTRRHYHHHHHHHHPGMSDKRSKSQSFDCFVCGKSFNSEKYLTMHISLHGTVKCADELLIPEPESPESTNVPSPAAKQVPEVSSRHQMAHPGLIPEALNTSSLTPHQQLTQQVAALQQQSRQLQQQSALLQQQLQQQKVKNSSSSSNVKKSPTAINRIVSEGGGWSCTLCNKTFAHNSGYKNHMRTHSNERPYVCTICDIGFKEKYHLKKHNLFIHSSELPEKCRFCGKRFKDSTAVRAHERIHSDERPFACRRCTKTFKTSECLWHHEHRSKTCGQALGDIIAKERAQRKRRKFPKNDPEPKIQIKEEQPEMIPVANPDEAAVLNDHGATSSVAAITAANAAIERNVQAIMMAEQRKAKENQIHKEYLIPDVVIKMEQDELQRNSSCSLQQPFPLHAGLIPTLNKPSDFVPPPVTKNQNQPNQTVINMLSQPPRPVQPNPLPSSTQPIQQAVPQVPIGRPIMSTMVKPVQHVQPQQQQQQQSAAAAQQKATLPQQAPPTATRPLQQHPPQVVLPQQQKPQVDQVQPSSTKPQPPQAVVQPQPRQPQPSNAAPSSSNPGDSKDFACKLCNKSFKDVSSFQRHCKIHTEERPFICEMCDIGFKMKVHLKKHNLYVHSDEYPCECRHCGKRFKDSSAVKLHERTHSDSRPFQCDGCQKAFKTRENLWGHQHRGKCMATKNKPAFVGVGLSKECFNGKPSPMSAHASLSDHQIGAHASVADDHVTAQAYVSTSNITAQAIIQNNQVTAHAMFNNSRVTAHASIVNNKLHAQAYVTNPSDPTGEKSSVDVNLEKSKTETRSASKQKEKDMKEDKAGGPGNGNGTQGSKSPQDKDAMKANCYSLEDPQALDASVLTSQMRAAISSTPVASIDDEPSPATTPLTSATSSPAAVLKPPGVNASHPPPTSQPQPRESISAVLNRKPATTTAPGAPPNIAVPAEAAVSPTGTPSQTSPSAKWPTLKEFLAKGVTGTTMSPPAQVTNWFNDNHAEQVKKVQNNNTKMTTANDYPTIKERLMGSFFANTAAGIVDPPPRQQNTVGMVTRNQPPRGVPRIIPGGPLPPPYPATNKLSPPPPYPVAKSPASAVTTSPTAMEIASIMSSAGGGAIPSFQSTFLSKRTPPLPPISSLGSSPVMMRGEDPSIPIVYWDEDSSEKESHWHGSGSSTSSTDSMFHDMSMAEKMLTQL